MLGDLISEIRFLSMTSEEFASTPVLSGILTEKECVAIFMNLNNPGSLPMPLHLSSCKMKRRGANSSNFSSSSAIYNGERSTKSQGIYCLRQMKNDCFEFIKDPYFFGPWSPLTGMTSFFVDQDVTIKGIIIAEMILNQYYANNSFFNAYIK